MCSPCHSYFKVCHPFIFRISSESRKGISAFIFEMKKLRSAGVGDGNPLQYSRLENSTDREAWQAAIHGVTKSWIWLSTLTHTHTREDNWSFKILCQISHRATLTGLSWAIQVTAPSRSQHCLSVPVTSKHLNITTNWTPKCSRWVHFYFQQGSLLS